MLEDYDDYDDYDEERVWPVRAAVVGALVLAVAAVIWIGALPIGGGGEDSGGEQAAIASRDSGPVATSEATSPTSSPDNSVAEVREGESSASDEADGDIDSRDTTATTADSTQPEPSSTDTVLATPGTDAPAVTSPTYETLPDGSPVPVLAIFDGELIALSGSVPSEAAAQRLSVLALANSADPGAEVASFLTIDPNVPIGVGVRVIEMNSARFPEGSSDVSPEHGLQLDRVVAIMNAFPNITVEVIGHSDQRGDDETNFVLSTERARAAADYVASGGVDRSRLSSRGAGESDLLTLNNDDAALALNRRTEFVFYGLLVDAPEPT